MTTASQIRLDKSHNLPYMKPVKSHNLTLLKTNLATSSNVRLAGKLAKSLIKTNNKIHEP